MYIALTAGESVSEILEFAINFYNKCWDLIISLLTLNPTSFAKGESSAAWTTITNAYNVVLPVGTALLVVYFLMYFLRTTTNFTEAKRPEHVIKMIVRYVIAAYVILHGLQLLVLIMKMATDLTYKMVTTLVSNSNHALKMPEYLATTLSSLKLTSHPIQSILSLMIAFLGMGLIIFAMASILITLYGRFFKIFMYVVLAPIPLASFGGEQTQHMGVNYLKSFAAICFETVSATVAIIVYIAVSPYLLEGVQTHEGIDKVSIAYNEMIDKYDLKEEDLIKLRNGEITFNDFATDRMREAAQNIQGAEDLNLSNLSLDERMTIGMEKIMEDMFYNDASLVAAHGYHKALLEWLVPLIFGIFLLSTTIKSVDQITAKIIGIGG